MAFSSMIGRGMTLAAFATLATIAGPALAQDRPTVAAANYPLAYFAERLSGAEIDVLFPIPAETDPSFWRPSISDIAAIQAADLVALNGAGFSTWQTKASLPRSRTIDTSARFSDRFIRTEAVTHSHGDDGEHTHVDTASYTWLDFSLAIEQADALAGAMTRQLPDYAENIATQRDDLVADLSALDERAMAITGPDETITVITSHPRYQYFGEAYGLAISTLEWDAQGEPTPDQWSELEALLSQTEASLFIWEAEPSAQSRAQIQALGIVDVVFPPLANTPAEGAFIALMNEALDQLELAIGQIR